MENQDESNQSSLSDMFDSAFKLFTSLNKTEEATNSLKVQIDIKKCMKTLEDATKLVSIADIFSTNESFDEIPTEQIKYFLLPALLGTLATKLCDRDNRMHNVEVSEIYFYDFLERVKSYGITDVEIPERKSEENPTDESGESSQQVSRVTAKNDKINTAMIESMVNTRKNKLQRYKEEKELKEKLIVLEENMNNPNIDDESKRNYFTTMIKLYAMQAVDEINSLSQEKDILKHMAKLKKDGGDAVAKNMKNIQPKLKPIIITKNDVQKKVFGAGYPSLPVMTVSEFYDKKVADGEWPAGGEPGTTIGGKSLTESTSAEGEYKEAQEDPDKIEKERQIEEDSDEYLARTRAMDDYKDTHKRGWGNRYNRS